MNQFYALLATISINASEIGYTGKTGDGGGLIKPVLNTVYFWAAALAVIVIVIAGIIYATSQGDASGISKAKNAILGAVVGLIIILSAFVITNFVLGRF